MSKWHYLCRWCIQRKKFRRRYYCCCWWQNWRVFLHDVFDTRWTRHIHSCFRSSSKALWRFLNYTRSYLSLSRGINWNFLSLMSFLDVSQSATTTSWLLIVLWFGSKFISVIELIAYESRANTSKISGLINTGKTYVCDLCEGIESLFVSCTCFRDAERSDCIPSKQRKGLTKLTCVWSDVH